MLKPGNVSSKLSHHSAGVDDNHYRLPALFGEFPAYQLVSSRAVLPVNEARVVARSVVTQIRERPAFSATSDGSDADLAQTVLHRHQLIFANRSQRGRD